MNASQCSEEQCAPRQQWNNGQSYSTGSSNCDSQECCPLESLKCIAKCAKAELLKEKIKAQLEGKIGKKLDQAAELAADMLIECHQSKVNYMGKKEEAMNKLKEIMSS